MNRSDGLVQRRNISRDSTDGSLRDPQENDSKPDHDEEAEDGDSKETRLTLMEEVLLLGIKDKEVRYAPVTRVPLQSLVEPRLLFLLF